MLDRFSSRTVGGGDGSAPNSSDPGIGRRRVNGNQRCSLLGPTGVLYDPTSERRASAGPREPPGDGGSWSLSVGEGGSSFAHAVLAVQSETITQSARVRNGARQI